MGGEALLHALFRRATGVELFSTHTQLEAVTLLLYRALLKHLHRSYPRAGAFHAKAEEFAWLFHRAAAETNLGRKEAYLQALAEVERRFRSGDYPPLPAMHYSTTNTYPGTHCEENALTLWREDVLHSQRK